MSVTFGIPVYQSEFAPTHFDDGRPRLYQLGWDFSNEPLMLTPMPLFATPAPKPKSPTRRCVLVHPSRWEAFWMAVNQPDVFKHPEAQELLGYIKTS